MRAPIVVLNAALQPVADLGAVIEVGYTQHLRELWTATFTLRADDPKRVHCRPFAFVRLFDGGNEVGLFRIAPQRARRGGDRTTIEYQCEHALACLADDMMVGPHNVTPPSSALRDAITYILSRQTTARWTLDRLDFTRTWWHYWEDRTLLEALHHALELIPGEWMLTFDTSVSPWRLNVVAVPTAVEAYLDAGRNLEAVERDEDPRGVVTRLYAYGHGIGADQINVRSVNPTGQEFIDAATIGEFGVIARVWEDQRFTTPAGLFEGANARLARLSRPPVTYTVGALDLSRITGLSTDRLVLGRRIRIVDEEMGVNHVERISQIRKHDVIGDPDAADIVIGERHEFPDYGDIAYADDLDGVRDGGSFGRVLSTQIEAGRIKLSAVPGGTVGAFPTPPNIAGLYVGASHFGFHNGAAWTTFMDAAGRFRLVSTGGSLTFDPTLTPPLLELRGRMTIEPGSTGFTNLTDTPVGLIRSYFQTAPPDPAVVALTAGDLWFDTDAGNRAHRWSGTAWVDAQDSGIPQAILAASNAQATADGKVRTYFQAPPAPTTGLSVGDLWVNTADHNRLHRWNGTAWIVFTGALASLNVVGTAYIADLAVTTAKIGDLQVTTAKIASLTFDKLIAGTNTASLVIGSGGEIRSANFVSGSAGFRILGTGVAEFQQVTIRGAVQTIGGSVINCNYATEGILTGRIVRTAASGHRAQMAPSGVFGVHAVEIINHLGHATAAMVASGVAVRDVNGNAAVTLEGGAGEVILFGGARVVRASGGNLTLDAATGGLIIAAKRLQWSEMRYTGTNYTGGWGAANHGIFIFGADGQRYAIPLHGPV